MLALSEEPCIHGVRPGSCVQCRNSQILNELEDRIKALEAENAELRGRPSPVDPPSPTHGPLDIVATVTVNSPLTGPGYTPMYAMGPVMTCGHPVATLDTNTSPAACAWCRDLINLSAEALKFRQQLALLQTAMALSKTKIDNPEAEPAPKHCGSQDDCDHPLCAYDDDNSKCRWCVEVDEAGAAMCEEQGNCDHPVAARENVADEDSDCQWCKDICEEQTACNHPICARYDRDDEDSGCKWCDELEDKTSESCEEQSRCDHPICARARKQVVNSDCDWCDDVEEARQEGKRLGRSVCAEIARTHEREDIAKKIEALNSDD
jgi:hypothetical protein